MLSFSGKRNKKISSKDPHPQKAHLDEVDGSQTTRRETESHKALPEGQAQSKKKRTLYITFTHTDIFVKDSIVNNNSNISTIIWVPTMHKRLAWWLRW